MMTAKELREVLQDCPDDMPVVVQTDGCTTDNLGVYNDDFLKTDYVTLRNHKVRALYIYQQGR